MAALVYGVVRVCCIWHGKGSNTAEGEEEVIVLIGFEI